MKTFRVRVIAAIFALALAPHAKAQQCVASSPITQKSVAGCPAGTIPVDKLVYSVNGTPGCSSPESPGQACMNVCQGYNGSTIVSGGPFGTCRCLDAAGTKTGGGIITQGVCKAAKCARQSMLDEDQSVADAGGRINRDENGNIVSIEQPVGVTVSQSGGYDAFGRFSWSDELDFKWDAQGGIYPTAIGIAGQEVHVRFTKEGRLNFSYVYDDNGLRIDWLSYWDNGSVQWHTAKNQYGTTSYQYNEDGTQVKPQTAPARIIKTAAATVAVPTPQLGVHQITMQPGGSLYQVPVIAAGATLLYPPAREGLVRLISGAWHACFPADSMDPSDVDRRATDKYFNDRLACYQAVSEKYKDKPMDTPEAINAQADDIMRCMASADHRRALRAAGTEEGALPPLVLP